MPTLASHDSDGITNSTDSLLDQDDGNKMQHDFFSHLKLLALVSALYDANAIVSSTIIFIRSRCLKQCVI